MLSVQKIGVYNSNIFDPVAQITPLEKALSWIVVIATSILSLGILPCIAFGQTAWKISKKIPVTNRTIETIFSLFKKNVPPPSPKVAILPPAFSPIIRTNTASSFSSTPGLPVSPNLLMEDPVFRTLSWQLFPHPYEVLSTDDIQIKADAITGILRRVNSSATEDYLIDAADIFPVGEGQLRKYMSLILDYLVLTNQIGMYARMKNEPALDDSIRYMVTLSPQLTTSIRDGLDVVDTANKEILLQLDAYMYQKAQMMEACRELNPQLNLSYLSLILNELINFNYIDFKQHAQKAPEFALTHTLLNRTFEVEPYLNFLRDQGIILIWNKNFQSEYEVVVDERFRMPDTIWRGNVSVDEARSFQRTHKIQNYEEILDDFNETEQGFLRYFIQMMNKRSSDKTVYFKLSGVSVDSLSKFIPAFNNLQNQVICSRIEGADPHVIKCIKSWRSAVAV